MAKFCGKCGSPLEAGSRFCTNCGEPVKDADEELTVPLKSLEEKPEKKIGLSARAVRGSDVNPKETNKNADVSADDADDVLKQNKKKRSQKANNTTNVPKKKTGLGARAVRGTDNNRKEKNAGESANGTYNVLKQKEADNKRAFYARNRDTQQQSEPKTSEFIGEQKASRPQYFTHGNHPVYNTPKSPQNNTKKIAIIVGIIVGVIAIGAFIYCFATGILLPKSTAPISFKINIDDGFTKDSTPIVAKITDQSDKSKVTYTTFTPEDKNGKEIEMPKGQYEIVMISPVNADGSIYDMGKTVSVDTATEEERNINTNCKRIAAENVTSEQIQGIADALKEASGNESFDISESEITKANERVKAKQAEEEKQRKAAEKQAAIDNAIAQGYDQIVTGKILMLDDQASVDNYFPDNLKYNGALNSSYRTPYVLLCFDSPQDITALTSRGTANTKQVNEICLYTDPESWRPYNGQTITVALNMQNSSWPSGLNVLQMTAKFRQAMFVWKD